MQIQCCISCVVIQLTFPFTRIISLFSHHSYNQMGQLEAGRIYLGSQLKKNQYRDTGKHVFEKAIIAMGIHDGSNSLAPVWQKAEEYSKRDHGKM